jgi:putative acetyltransferase
VRAALMAMPEADREIAVRGMELYGRALQRARQRQDVTMATVTPDDNRPLATLIRDVMEEHGVLGPGTAHEDVEVDGMFEAYTRPRHVYYVLKRKGKVVGGGGIGPLSGGSRDTCELRKMYLLPEVRGLGLGSELLQACLSAAKSLLYRRCYLETVQQMRQARSLYERAGFVESSEPQGSTGHTACDAWYVKEL